MSQKLGQHFLKNQLAIKKIITALDPQHGETIIEIGAGTGALTMPLAEQCSRIGCKVVAIEKDSRLAEALQIANRKWQIVQGDVLETLPKIVTAYTLNPIPYKLVGNLPYYITGKLLRTVSELELKPTACVFMLQREVAERIAAKPPTMNLLAAATQIWAEPKIIAYLKPEDFDPPPKVESAVVALATSDKRQATRSELDTYYRFIKILFKQPRKTILNNLAHGFPNLAKTKLLEILQKNGLTGTERPQNLALEVLITLSRCV